MSDVQMRPPLSINIHDADLGIWQDDAHDPSFRSDVYGELIRRLRLKGWSIRFDPNIRRNYRRLNTNHRLGARGTLRCAIEASGRVVKVDFWSTTAKRSNRNGRRYDFDRMQRMHHIDRLRVELEFKRTIAWLETIAPLKVSRSDVRDMPAMERIAKSYEESFHKDKTLGRPVCQYDYNRKSADGELLEHGQTVWVPDRKGRIVRGTAFYHINNMWWVVAGGQLFNESAGKIFSQLPADLRNKRNERQRRQRLEGELALAIQRMQFLRAETLKSILFDGDPVFLIWSRKNNAYYRPQYSGYTTDTICAGRYTRVEAEREVRRVPHLLDMVTSAGEHIRFDKEAA